MAQSLALDACNSAQTFAHDQEYIGLPLWSASPLASTSSIRPFRMSSGKSVWSVTESRILGSIMHTAYAINRQTVITNIFPEHKSIYTTDISNNQYRRKTFALYTIMLPLKRILHLHTYIQNEHVLQEIMHCTYGIQSTILHGCQSVQNCTSEYQSVIALSSHQLAVQNKRHVVNCIAFQAQTCPLAVI